MGFNCLRKLAVNFKIPVNDDPRPDDPIPLTWEEFRQVRISDEFVHPFRSNPYSHFGVFVHLVKECSQPLA